MTNKQLIKKLENACIVCHDCGKKYGVYSVGCSSTWQAKCPICEEIKGCTETRDYGYLMTGIRKLLKEDADCVLTQEPIMTDEDLDKVMNPSYLQGEITLNLTEEEVGFLNECLDTLQEFHCTLQSDEAGIIVPEDVALFESVEEKITELYQDHCVKYELSAAMKAYNAKYGTFGFHSEMDTARWEGFRDAFTMNTEVAK
jgi:hypothetical protein